MKEKWVKDAERYVIHHDRKGDWMTLDITMTPDKRLRINAAEFQMWQGPEELAAWLEWCAKQIRKLPK